MKTLLTLTIVATLISCGNSARKKSRSQLFLEQYGQNLSAKQGEVTEEVEDGQDTTWDMTSGRYVVSDVKIITKRTVLKVTGSDVYTLVEKNFNGLMTKAVELKEDNQRDLMKLYVDQKKGTVKNHVLSVEGLESTIIGSSRGQNGEDIPFEVVQTSTLQQNLITPCDRTETIVKRELANRRPTTKTVRKQSCRGILTSEELKLIDLSKITFCHRLDSGYGCEDDQDLNYLVQIP